MAGIQACIIPGGVFQHYEHFNKYTYIAYINVILFTFGKHVLYINTDVGALFWGPAQEAHSRRRDEGCCQSPCLHLTAGWAHTLGGREKQQDWQRIWCRCAEIHTCLLMQPARSSALHCCREARRINQSHRVNIDPYLWECRVEGLWVPWWETSCEQLTTAYCHFSTLHALEAYFRVAA